MRLFKKEPNFNFMNKRYMAFSISGLIIIAGVILFFSKGFNLGIDFTGGTLVDVIFKESKTVKDVRESLGKVDLSKSMIQKMVEGNNRFIIKSTSLAGTEEDTATPAAENAEESLKNIRKTANLISQSLMSEDEVNLSKTKKDLNNSPKKELESIFDNTGIPVETGIEVIDQILTYKENNKIIHDYSELESLGFEAEIMNILREKTFLGSFSFLMTDIVGPQVGKDLRSKTTLATVWALLGMLVYIGIRFKLIYGFAAVITLFHDVIICLSFIIFLNIEMSLQVVAALIFIVGYSLNDTIVIFDRVRDNLKIMRRDNAESILDRSVNQTLSRTIVTSGTTLAAVLSLFFLGGEVIHSFSLTLIIGILIGTYSSIFQSCAWLRMWERIFLGRKIK